MKPGRPQADELPRPPSPQLLHIAAFGEPATLARLVMLYLQAFDYHGTNALPFRKLDYQHLTGWLASIQDLDKLSEYPLFVAARVYSDVPDKGRQRMMLEFVYRQFLLDPNRRWQWLAHAALVAKHQLKDLQLARKYAHAVDQLTTATNVPLWGKADGDIHPGGYERVPGGSDHAGRLARERPDHGSRRAEISGKPSKGNGAAPGRTRALGLCAQLNT